MWSQEVRDAFDLFIALAESKLTEVCEVVTEFISEYRYYILIGLIILGILVSPGPWDEMAGKEGEEKD